MVFSKQLYSKSALLLITSFFILSTLFSFVQAEDKEGIIPEIASTISQKERYIANEFMVVAANPYAVKAGFDILKEGGNAIDAMIATQLVLNLVEPQSSGIGGGALLVYYDADSKTLKTFDGRETAPEAVTPELFLDSNGKPVDFWDAVVGGKSVGTPGTLKLMEYVHIKYGKLPWPNLFIPALTLAESGFLVTERLATQIQEDPYLKDSPTAKDYFFTVEGTPLQEGTILKNPQFAETLKRIALQGSAAFYDGPLAQDIIQTVQTAHKNPGLLSLNDLKNYQIIEREPVCTAYKNYTVCGMGPPTSGGITVQQILGQLSYFSLENYNPLSPESIHLFSESAKLAYADRGAYIADSDFIHVPISTLLDPTYLQSRSQLIDPNISMGTATEGKFNQELLSLHWNQDTSLELPSTSHISIVDRNGNALAMTTTIENSFGSRLMTNGFLLNNELTDFSFQPIKLASEEIATHEKANQSDDNLIANRIEPGKRPRSSMAPTIIFHSNPLLNQDAKPYMIIGSPGGSRIINYVAQTILGVLDWNLDIQEAINLPHYVNRNGEIEIEEGSALTKAIPLLEAKGHKVIIQPQTSGLHGIIIRDGYLEGGADPRREGMALGQ